MAMLSDYDDLDLKIGRCKSDARVMLKEKW